MTFEYEWTEDKDVRLYWKGEEITDGPLENQGDGKNFVNGVPKGAKEYASQWLSEQSVPDETQLQEAIEQLAAIVANDFEERDAE